VLTLHDTLWMDLPVLRGGRRGAGRFIDAYLRSVPRLAARQAAAIITVSEFSKRELCSRLGLSEDLVVVTPEAASNALASSPSAAQVSGTLARLGLASGFVLALASNDPRKNFAGVMDAYSRLPEAVQEAHPLVGTVASASALKGVTRLVLAHGMTDKVRLFHGLSNEELHHVYCSASIFVFPSLGEGFGLPVLEAMASGTPVVTANATSLPEVAGDAALLCDPRSPEATAAHVLSVLSNPALRASLVEKGRQRAAAFSWRRCADATVACYERTLRRLHSVAPGFRSIGARP
jgi:alpha-1,3-rhamnosyl/mannosyltransferase